MRYQVTPGSLGQGIGVRENQLHVATGLRTAQIHAVVPSFIRAFGSGNITQFEGIMPFETPQPDWSLLSGAPTPDWVSMRVAGGVWNPVLPVPMTPTVTFLVFPIGSPFPQTVQVKILMRGTDQFGNTIEEESPWIAKVMTTTSAWFMVHMSKVFATVDQMYLKGINIAPTSSLTNYVSVGWCGCIDPLMAEASASSTLVAADFLGYYAPTIMALLWNAGGIATTNFDLVGTEANWGIGAPVQMEPYGPPNPFPSPDILGATAVLLNERTTPTSLNTTASLPARGQAAVSGAPPTTGVAIGRSAPGWNGTPHKLGFFSTDDWVTKISGINLGGSSTRAGGVPVGYVQLGENNLLISAMLRTTIGTQRGSNATSSYPQG